MTTVDRALWRREIRIGLDSGARVEGGSKEEEGKEGNRASERARVLGNFGAAAAADVII